MTKPAKILAVLLMILPVTVTVRADEVRVGRLPYSGVTVTDFSAGELVFRTAGREITRPLSSITRIELSGRSDFNLAEEMLVDKRYEEAAQAYRRAEDATTGVPWLRRLISCRLVQALDGAGRFDEAVHQWLLATGDDGAEELLMLRPANLAPQGEQVNSRAINLLEIRLNRVENEQLRRSIRELLLELYWLEGRHEKAAEMAELLGDVPQPPSDIETATDGAARQVHGGQLADIRGLLDENRPERALEFVLARMARLDEIEMPEALLLAGRARMALYQARGSREHLLSAGLDFMRVAVFYAGTDFAAEALYRAGEVNEELGNASAARAAWQLVIARYGDSEYAERAVAGIERIGRAARDGGDAPIEQPEDADPALGT